jgi:hypothetical protein
VLFLYRDEVHNKDSEFPGVVVDAAKVRHGPPGEVSVFFKKDFAEFADLEIWHTPLEYDDEAARNGRRLPLEKAEAG